MYAAFIAEGLGHERAPRNPAHLRRVGLELRGPEVGAAHVEQPMCEGNTAVDDDDGRLKHAATAMYLHKK